MTSRPTATSFAILGLLGIQPWTAYELVAQAKRSLHHFWPRSEAHLYAEIKRIVERGHASAEVIEGRSRQRTRYTITESGRRALRDWLATEPAPPSLEIEALLRVLLADQGTTEDPRAALQATSTQARALRSASLTLGDEILAGGSPFPERLHLIERVAAFYGEFLLLLIQWCDETLAEVQSWPDTRNIGLTPSARNRLTHLLTRARRNP
jgi:PadR family transcriptional regulator, regulatory protein AphA